MALTKRGVAYLAASQLSSKRVAEIAADYEDWIDDQLVADDAWDALLAAAKSSKNPDRVLANADAIYSGFDITPTITSITPNTGGTAGGTEVVIAGLNLTGSTSVTFGGTAGTAFSVVSDTSIAVTTPAKTAGAKDVVVVNANGNATSTGGFTYS